LGRWLLVACFSSVKNHNVSGPHLFPNVTTIPLPPLGRSTGHSCQDKLAANPLSASSRTSAQKDAMAKKQARTGNLSTAIQTVCLVLKPAFGHDTPHKLQEKTPVGSVVSDKQFCPTTDALDEMHRHDEWLNIQQHSFSIKKIGQYLRTCKPLSAQDADGWRGREHVGWQFLDGDSTLQESLCTHLILPKILGDFLAEHLDEIAGAECLCSKRQTTHYAPSTLALYGVDALYVSALRKCAAVLLLFSCRNSRISFNFAENQMGPLDAHKSLNF